MEKLKLYKYKNFKDLQMSGKYILLYAVDRREYTGKPERMRSTVGRRFNETTSTDIDLSQAICAKLTAAVSNFIFSICSNGIKFQFPT